MLGLESDAKVQTVVIFWFMSAVEVLLFPSLSRNKAEDLVDGADVVDCFLSQLMFPFY
jgi:hypothetical protein